jgi:2-polyprenyl-3-methyl-5-hydroxy-6-metoxy-1,4-benzoquinol methylase
MRCPQCSTAAILDQEIDRDTLVALYKEKAIPVARLLPNNRIQYFRCSCCSLGFFSPAIPGDDEFYNYLASLDWYYCHDGKSEYDYAASWISDGDRVVDVGAGIGEFSRYMPLNALFLGIELSSEAVKVAESLGRNVVHMDITSRVNELEASFDVVTCFQVLEHLQDPNLLVKSLEALCKPGGVLIIAVPNNGSFVGRGVNNLLDLPPHHLLHWNKQSLIYLANKNNLHVEAYVEERLQDVHRVAYYYSWLTNIILKITKKKYKLVNYPDNNKFLSRQVGRIAKLLSLILPKSRAPGHTSIIVLRKPNE